MRAIRNADRYQPAAAAAQALREAADRIAAGDDMVHFSIQFWFASREEVAVSLGRAQQRRGSRS